MKTLSKILLSTFLLLNFSILTAQAAEPLCRTQEECLSSCALGDGNCQILCTFLPETCERTYYFCGFNTYAADFVWLEIKSQTTTSINGAVFAYNDKAERIAQTSVNFGGSASSRASFTLNSLERVDFPVYSWVGGKRHWTSNSCN